jgi:hypothetical protein
LQVFLRQAEGRMQGPRTLRLGLLAAGRRAGGGVLRRRFAVRAAGGQRAGKHNKKKVLCFPHRDSPFPVGRFRFKCSAPYLFSLLAEGEKLEKIKPLAFLPRDSV